MDKVVVVEKAAVAVAVKVVFSVMMVQVMAAAAAAAADKVVLQDLSETDAITNGLPLFHVAATISCGLSFFIAGANVIVLSPAGMRNPVIIKNFWKIVERYRASVIGGVALGLGWGRQ